MGKKCIFCNEEKKMSKEHVFPQWLLKELGIVSKEILMKHLYTNIELSERKHLYNSFVNGCVCEECNNGWMSSMEAELQPHIINLMNFKNINEELMWLKKTINFLQDGLLRQH